MAPSPLRYHMTFIPSHGHPLSTPHSPSVATHRIVLYDKIGPGPHHCHWCGTSLEWRPGAGHAPDAIIADHLDRNIGNNRPENLVPSCNPCNVRDNYRRIGEAMPTEEKRTTVRLPPDLLERLRVQAQQERRSWNAHVIYLLEVAEAQEREWLEGSSASSS